MKFLLIVVLQMCLPLGLRLCLKMSPPVALCQLVLTRRHEATVSCFSHVTGHLLALDFQIIWEVSWVNRILRWFCCVKITVTTSVAILLLVFPSWVFFMPFYLFFSP